MNKEKLRKDITRIVTELIDRLNAKYYKAIAEIIKNERENWGETSVAIAVLSGITKQLADYFAADNPQFDRDKFIAACGLTS